MPDGTTMSPIDGKKLEKAQGLGTLYVNGVEVSKHSTDWEQHALAALDDPSQPTVEFHPAPIRLKAPYVSPGGLVYPPDLEPKPDPVSEPPVEPEPPADPPPSDPGMPNNPGLPVVFDDSFAYDWNDRQGTPPGWDEMDAMVGNSRTIDDPSSPTGRSLETIYPAGLGGNGPLRINKNLGRAYDRIYVSWWVKWRADFDHNSNSEKLIYFNHNRPDYFLFQFHWGSEAVYKIRPDPNEPLQSSASGGDDHIRANRCPPDARGQLPYAPPLDGVWCQYELLFERATGTAKWWRNGELRAEHVGRTFASVVNVALPGVWGGGGDKQGAQPRWTGRFTVAAS